jgi:hypothetical protein
VGGNQRQGHRRSETHEGAQTDVVRGSDRHNEGQSVAVTDAMRGSGRRSEATGVGPQERGSASDTGWLLCTGRGAGTIPPHRERQAAELRADGAAPSSLYSHSPRCAHFAVLAVRSSLCSLCLYACMPVCLYGCMAVCLWA